MAKTKASEFSDEEIFLSDIGKALSHPARIKILKILSELKACICGDIVDRLPLAQSTVSQHLKELKRVGLIKGEIEGPATCYCLDEKMLSKSREKLNKLFSNVCGC